MSKRLDRPYRSGRSRDWLKTKCVLTDDFVIIGYQPGTGAVRAPLANLKIACFDGERLRYAGAVGTGLQRGGGGIATREARSDQSVGLCRPRPEGWGRRLGIAGSTGADRVSGRDHERRTAACQLQGVGGIALSDDPAVVRRHDAAAFAPVRDTAHSNVRLANRDAYDVDEALSEPGLCLQTVRP